MDNNSTDEIRIYQFIYYLYKESHAKWNNYGITKLSGKDGLLCYSIYRLNLG